MTEISEIQQRVVKGSGVAEVDVTRNRVFLLGENRWEDPSRLVGRNRQVGGGTNTDATTKCISCRGEGRLLCTGAYSLSFSMLTCGANKYLKDVIMSNMLFIVVLVFLLFIRFFIFSFLF